jgi:hypothetical protein
MNNTDEFSDLEAELEQLQPSRITAAFSERVSTGLHAGEVALEPSGYGIRGNRLFILSVGALAAAAAIALVFFLHDRQDRKDANAPSYQSPALVSAVDAIEAPPWRQPTRGCSSSMMGLQHGEHVINSSTPTVGKTPMTVPQFA